MFFIQIGKGISLRDVIKLSIYHSNIAEGFRENHDGDPFIGLICLKFIKDHVEVQRAFLFWR